MEVTENKPAVINTPEIKLPVIPKKGMLFKISLLLILGIGILIVLIGANIFLSRVKKPQTPVTGTPAPTPPASSTNASTTTSAVSGFGKSPQFQEFETKLKDLRLANETVDLSENTLGFPVLEMHVDYSNL